MPFQATSTSTSVTGRARSIALLVILLATFMDLMYVTLLNVALPTIDNDLGASPSQLQWILSGYTLALALGIITGARLGDLLGHKRLFIAGLLGFTAATILGAVAPDASWLVVARVIQGIFAAAMLPQALTQIQIMYSPRERGGPMAAFSTLAGLAATVGPILAPALMNWDLAGLGWRLVFWVTVPVGLLCAIAAAFLLPDTKAPNAARIDPVGVLISSAGLLLVIYPLTAAADEGSWPVWAWGSIAAGIAVLVGFVAHQRRRKIAGAMPLLEVSLFRIRTLAGGLTVLMLFFVPVMGFFMVFMLFVQNGLGMSPSSAGLIMLPWSVMVAVFAGVSATVLLPRFGRRTVQIGLVMLAFGFVLLAVAGANATSSTDWTDLIAGVLIGGAGMGIIVAPLVQLTLTDVPVKDAGSGSALYNTFAEVAASVGVAVVGLYYFTQIQGNDESDPVSAMGDAFAGSLVLGVALLAVAFVATWLLPRDSMTPAEPVPAD